MISNIIIFKSHIIILFTIYIHQLEPLIESNHKEMEEEAQHNEKINAEDVINAQSTRHPNLYLRYRKNGQGYFLIKIPDEIMDRVDGDLLNFIKYLLQCHGAPLFQIVQDEFCECPSDTRCSHNLKSVELNKKASSEDIKQYVQSTIWSEEFQKTLIKDGKEVLMGKLIEFITLLVQHMQKQKFISSCTTIQHFLISFLGSLGNTEKKHDNHQGWHVDLDEEGYLFFIFFLFYVPSFNMFFLFYYII